MTNEIILNNPKDKFRNIAAIGNFDGLHIAHQMLIRSAFLNTHKFGKGKSMVISFEPHTQSLFGNPPKLLIDTKTKREFCEGILGIDEYIELPFTQELADMSPENFVKKIIVERMQLDVVLIGFNFTFGKGGSGNAELLAQIAADYGVEVVISPAVTNCYGTISSSMVREHLSAGNMEAANKTLRYWYTLRGDVVKGNQYGRSMGFATANIIVPVNRAVPPNGVYSVRAVLDGKTYDGVANLGTKPTVSEAGELLLETHLFNFLDKDLYGKDLLVFLDSCIRPEVRFDSIEQLQRTVKDNIKTARSMLAYTKKNKHLPIEN